jgi:hypothetical protein
MAATGAIRRRRALIGELGGRGGDWHDPADGAGLGEAGDHHVEHRHREHALVGEAGEGLTWRQDAGEDEEGDGGGEDDVRADPAADERGEREADNTKSEPSLPGHARSVSAA